MLSDDELALLAAVNVSGQGPRAREVVEVECTGAAYSCCGKGWRRKDGYLQTYRGYVDNFEPAEDEHPERPLGVATFMLFSQGIGTLNYVVALRAPECDSVIPAAQAWPPARPGRSRW